VFLGPLAERSFGVVVLAVFPLGGLAVFLAIRVRLRYGVPDRDLTDFFSQRAPHWLSRAAFGTLAYGIVCLAAGAVLGARGVGTAAPVLATFYMMFLLIFTAALTDARLAMLALVLLCVASANAETCVASATATAIIRPLPK